MPEGVRGGRAQAFVELPLEVDLEGVVVRRRVIAVNDEAFGERQAQGNGENSQLGDSTCGYGGNEASSRCSNIRNCDALVTTEWLLHGNVEFVRVRQCEVGRCCLSDQRVR